MHVKQAFYALFLFCVTLHSCCDWVHRDMIIQSNVAVDIQDREMEHKINHRVLANISNQRHTGQAHRKQQAAETAHHQHCVDNGSPWIARKEIGMHVVHPMPQHIADCKHG